MNRGPLRREVDDRGRLYPLSRWCTWKWQRGDVSRHTGGDLRAALSRIKAKTFVMPVSSDMFFPLADCQAEWRLIPDAEFQTIQTIDGHLALLGADANAISQLYRHLSELLATKT
jgi:homoserine O-acetyltransferase